MADDAPLHTLAAAVTATGETIRGARFVALAAPIDMHDGAAAAAQHVAAARAEHDDAVHHGWAYRIGPEHPDFGWSDDGEPVGSAGASILRRIDALGLLNLVVVVSRWGGGQRLSTAELAKGYTEAARAVLAAASTAVFVPTTRVALEFAYGDSGPVQGVLAACRATQEHADYGEHVLMVVRVPSARLSALLAGVRDASAARARAEPLLPAGKG